MPFSTFMKCCVGGLEEAESYKQLVDSNNEVADSDVSQILPSTISRTSSPPKKESVKLPTPKEAEEINQEMIRAMENYRKRIHAQHIHHFLKFSHRNPRRRSTVTQSTMTDPVGKPHGEQKPESLKELFLSKGTPAKNSPLSATGEHL